MNEIKTTSRPEKQKRLKIYGEMRPDASLRAKIK